MIKLTGIGIAVALLLMGCAGQPVVTVPEESATAPIRNETAGWWYVRFRLAWPEEEEPLWWPDLLLADRVAGPVLDAEGEAIHLWRFHRRAARDDAGRQFSFIFRALPATARRVNARIAADPLLIHLQETGVVQKVSYDDPSQLQRPGIGDTSDKNWSPEMQMAWPYFILGVSRLWLELIRELERRGEWPEELLARYAAVEKALNEHWRDEGGHALLHHLSGVFGYRELVILRQDTMRF
ncbi:MAG TPA: hypothetical protein PLD30_13915 [Candidatus Competibacteraceae bacterium]|nr:hypothetical protein [Candidatus Competibacteraceae bacterium]